MEEEDTDTASSLEEGTVGTEIGSPRILEDTGLTTTAPEERIEEENDTFEIIESTGLSA